ncbi:MAG: hypothetical protein KAZ87_11165 [Spirochaetes bacterium]|nr:hypothetical protein [Spirochaetota bacterium]
MNIAVYLRIVEGRNYCFIDKLSESALEAALRLKDKSGFSLTIFSFGSAIIEKELRRAYSCGADKICFIESSKIKSPLSEAHSARIIAERNQSSLLILPAFSEEYSFSSFAPLAAEMLSFDYAERTDSFDYHAGGIDLFYEWKNSELKMKRCELPLVISYMGGIPLRYPLLKDRMSAETAAIDRISDQDIIEPYSLIETRTSDNNKTFSMSPEEAATVVIDLMMEKGMIKV